MSLPHHHRDPIPLVTLLRWLARLPSRLRCAIRGHLWRPYDMLTQECLSCRERRTLPVKRPLP